MDLLSDGARQGAQYGELSRTSERPASSGRKSGPPPAAVDSEERTKRSDRIFRSRRVRLPVEARAFHRSTRGPRLQPGVGCPRAGLARAVVSPPAPPTPALRPERASGGELEKRQWPRFCFVVVKPAKRAWVGSLAHRFCSVEQLGDHSCAEVQCSGVLVWRMVFRGQPRGAYGFCHHAAWCPS